MFQCIIASFSPLINQNDISCFIMELYYCAVVAAEHSLLNVSHSRVVDEKASDWNDHRNGLDLLTSIVRVLITSFLKKSHHPSLAADVWCCAAAEPPDDRMICCDNVVRLNSALLGGYWASKPVARRVFMNHRTHWCTLSFEGLCNQNLPSDNMIAHSNSCTNHLWKAWD